MGSISTSGAVCLLLGALGGGCQQLPGGCSEPCQANASCDAVVDRCFCDPGHAGDPALGCSPHADLCAEAEARLGHPVCEHEVSDESVWQRLSLGRTGDNGIVRATKYLVPAEPEARLPVTFADANWYRSHYCLIAGGFEPLFPGALPADYARWVLGKDTREYYGGTLHQLAHPDEDGPSVLYTVETVDREDELLSETQLHEVYRSLSDRFGAGALGYLPAGDAQTKQAEALQDSTFPVVFELGPPGSDYTAYTPGLAYGRVRVLASEDIPVTGPPPFGWQDLLVLEHAPLTLEGVMAGAITSSPQDLLSHLNVLSALRGTPNAHLANALDTFQALDGKLVRLDVQPDLYTIREVGEAEAQAFWAENRPSAELGAPADLTLTPVTAMDDIDVATPAGRSASVGRFGAKAVGIATLRSVMGPTHPGLVVTGLGIPMSAYAGFMDGNTWEAPVAGGIQTLTYAATVSAWLADPSFRTDAGLRAGRLQSLREEMMEKGVVAPALVDEVRQAITATFGASSVMVRFRSSSNAEDSLSFNGAGLYDSESACAGDTPDLASSVCDPGSGPRPVDVALRTVWASLWSLGAFEEREYYQLDHGGVAMGVAVTPRFADERANGVAFTGNPTDLTDPRFTINAQAGDVSVVGAPPGVVAELDRIRVDGGTVQVFRETASSLLPPGTYVLSDAQLTELGEILAEVASRYPVDGTPPEGARVMLDLEFKIGADGKLIFKQIRPFAADPYDPGAAVCPP